MANQEHLDILAKGVDAWNAWRAANRFAEVDFRDANLNAVDLSRADLCRVDLRKADLVNVVLSESLLSGANLQGAALILANLGRATLIGTNLDDADLRYATLAGANLRGAILDRADLREADLMETDLDRARAQRADFGRANLGRVNFKSASLIGSSFHMADLTGATFLRADLRDVSFAGSVLDESDFSGAAMRNAAFIDVDLSKARGLTEIEHKGPSTVGIDTIYRSKGNIPEIFLRGAGVPENLITYMKSLTGTALEFYSCFISYSTKDQDFAERLHADLQARGVRCWFAPKDIRAGQKTHDQIDEAIRLHDKLLLILSDFSMKSSWVKTEIADARESEERQKRQMLFPIAIVPFERIREWKQFDADTGIDSAREIREYFIPDFSNWKDHDSYQKAFDRLVRDLKAEGKDKA